MIFNNVAGSLCKTVFFLSSILWLAVGAANGSDPPAKIVKPSLNQREAKIDTNEWGKVLEAAKREGKIVMTGSPSEEWRKSLVDLFQQEYPEITVEYTGSNARDFWPRVRKERELGKKLWDLVAGGNSPVYEYKGEGVLDPIRPLLLPEIADDSKWIGGLDGLFTDREKKFMPAYTMTIQRTTVVNLEFIKGPGIKSSSQLNDPKFKGKIVIQTPDSGASFQALANLGVMYGENFIRDLLSKQNVTITSNIRQQTEWVVRGKYPIAIGFPKTQILPFLKQGLGKKVITLEDKIIPVGTSFGGIFLFADAPHPNAARVYINWLLSQKTQAQLTKNIELNSRRTDVQPVDKETAVDPVHLSRYYTYSTEENTEISKRFLPVIKEAMK